MRLRKLLKLTFGGLGCGIILALATFMTTFAASEKDGITTMATTANLHLREGAGTGYRSLAVMPENTSVQVFGMTASGWYDVEYEGKRGYAWYQYLNFEGNAEGTVHDGHVTDMYTTAPLRVRAQANTSSQILGVIPKGGFIPVISKHDGWFKVSYNGQEGYCYGEYLTFGQMGNDSCQGSNPEDVSQSTMNKLTVTAPLHVRAQANVNSEIIGYFKKGEVVNVYGQEGDWYKVKVNGKDGYSHSAYFY